MNRILTLFPKDTIVIAGGAAGIDKSAALTARLFGLQLKEYPANWIKYGKGGWAHPESTNAR